MNDQEKPKPIEVPDSIRGGLPENRIVGSVATRGIVSIPARDVVSRPLSAGRYNNAPVPHAGTAYDTTGNVERPTDHDPDEV